MTELGASGGQKGKIFLLVCHLHKKVHYVYQVNGNNGYWVARLAQDRFGFEILKSFQLLSTGSITFW